MIRGKQRFLTNLYVFCDFLAVQVAFLLSWWLKFESVFDNGQAHLPIETYFLWSLFYSITSITVGLMVSLYSSKRKKRYYDEIVKVSQTHIFSVVILLSALFLFKEVDLSRFFLGLFLFQAIVYTLIYRYVVKNSLKLFRRKGYNKQFILILGAGSLGRRFYSNVVNHPELGYEVIGFLDDFRSDHDNSYKHLKPILGTLDELEDKLKEHLIDEVVIALPLIAHEKYGDVIAICEKSGVRTLIIPDFFDYLPARPNIDTLGDIPLINVRNVPLDDLGNRLMKRLFDTIFSTIVLVILAPLLIIIAVGVKLSSPGPILFKQERMGLNRKTFKMYKFRSMNMSNDNSSETLWTTANDPRKTKFGAFLRKTSLDELPQFINVLKGDMSVVGPRPERPYFVDQFKQEIPKYMIKHHVRPGITGWAQANGLRGDTSIEARIDHDLFYIENWTIILDIKIIIKTIINGFIDKNAY